ncbi:hypothetical protein LCGC14_1287230 [marine sediment metagenome]|uniref:Uncharacterized protein n=1 Tax=marine sediment metagenome TaxID=412755 RepID=A0A0F9NA27_9ZZZZ
MDTKNAKDSWQRSANSIMLGILLTVITAGFGLLINIMTVVDTKMDTIIIRSAENTIIIEAHERAIINLENMPEELKKHIDKYYQRKR